MSHRRRRLYKPNRLVIVDDAEKEHRAVVTLSTINVYLTSGQRHYNSLTRGSTDHFSIKNSTNQQQIV